MPDMNDSESVQHCNFLTFNINKLNQVRTVYMVAVSLHSLLILPTITLNIVLIVSLYRSTEIRKPSTKLLFSLANSDLLVGLILEPTMLAKKVAELDNSFLLYCNTGMITYVAGASVTLVSLGTLTLIALDRYLVVHKGAKYSSIVANTRVKVLVIGLWVIAFILPVGQLFTARSVFFGVAAVIFVVCIVTSSVCYLRCFFTLRKQRRQIGNLTEGNARQNVTNDFRYKKSMYTMLYVFLVFNLCSLPYLCTSISAGILGESAAIWGAESIVIVINNTHSLLNPIVLLWRMKQIRKVVVMTMSINTTDNHFHGVQTPQPSRRGVTTIDVHAQTNATAAITLLKIE